VEAQRPKRTATKKGQLPVSCKSSAERGNLVLLLRASEPGESTPTAAEIANVKRRKRLCHNRTSRDTVRRGKLIRWRQSDAEAFVYEPYGQRRNGTGVSSTGACRRASAESSRGVSRSCGGSD